MKVEFDPNLQGQHLRHSCLADQLELQAIIEGQSFSRSDLADRIKDSSWLDILSPRMTNDPSLDDHNLTHGEKQDRCTEISESILSLIEKRKKILGVHYPFQKDRFGRLSLMNEIGSYLWLLGLSLSHGYGLDCAAPPHKSFELSVSKALANTGFSTSTMGTAGNGTGFRNALTNVQSEIPSFVATPENAVFPISANDCGGDTVAAIPFESDTRHGHWAFVGQSTVGKSDTWQKKIGEVSIEFWQKVLADRVIVVPFFATPYHVSDHHLELLVQNNRRGIWDRLRLVKFLKVEPEETRETLSLLRTVQLS